MTPFVTMTLYEDSAGKHPIGVEGFADLEALASFALHAAHRIHPTWKSVQADTYNDMREVLSVLDTIDATARFLVGLDYPDEQVRKTLSDQFPGADVDAAMTQAHDHKTRLESETAEVEQRQADAARASELDLSKSMHDAP